MDKTRYLLVGGGVASVWAAITIRAHDNEGRLVLVGAEPNPPTDRPPLSKKFLLDDNWTKEDPESKAREFYPENNIELITGVRVTAIDKANRTATLSNGQVFEYEKLLLATGSSVITLNLPGADLDGIHYLRTVDDADRIRGAMKQGGRAVMVGAGYIGLEVAAACVQRGLDVTVVEPAEYPWSRFASPTTGKFLQNYFEKKGVRFVFGSAVTGFRGSGKVAAVQTGAGEIEADFVVAGVGVRPNIELAKTAGLEIANDRGVAVDEFLQTSDPNIWAAGDIAHFNDIALQTRWQADHHLNAKWQGRHVGGVMAGDKRPYDQVAYFYSDLFDLHMNLRGNPMMGRNSKVHGDVEAGEFVELYFDDFNRITMTLAFSHDDPKLDKFSDLAEQLIRARANVTGFNRESLGF